MASSAAPQNHTTDSRCPGRMASAASSGPSAVPIAPPTWNIDCASPRRVPAARCATREDFRMKGRRSDADERRGGEQKRIGRRQRQADQSEEGEHHADRQRIGHLAAIGVGADQGLQQRRRHLEHEGDEADMGEVQIEGRFQVGIDRLQQRLHHVVQRMAEADGEQHDEYGRMHLQRCGMSVVGDVVHGGAH